MRKFAMIRELAVGAVTRVVALAAVSIPVFAAVPGRNISGDYRVVVDGRETDVVMVPTHDNGPCDRLQWQPYSYSRASASRTSPATAG